MRSEKKSIVEAIRDALSGHVMLIFTDHTGLSAPLMNELRSALKKSGARYMVVKNALLRRALSQEQAAVLGETIAGPIAVAVTPGDCVALSRVVVDFVKRNGAPRVKAGYFGGEILDASRIGVLAALPPREVLLARFVGGAMGPLAGFIRCLAEVTRRFISVIDALAKKSGSAITP